jgi:phenylalanyl-tRNA synthetase beta chain
MLVSLEWLRSLCRCTASPQDAARALTDRGLTVDGVTARGDDTVLELDVPANRPDCLGHLGVARELGAAFGVPLEPRPEALAGAGADAGETVTVEIADPELCPRYTARVVRGVRVGASPPWVARRLEACGLRSINNVVDASNLVLLELGNPIHFFDLAHVHDASIIVRRALAGETLTTLDGEERRLDPEMLLIADPDRGIALAGVMGGADSEIGESTRDVLIEAACFAPTSIRSTSRRLGLRSDASHRFERGVDPEGVLAAQEMAVRLLVELAGGTPVPGLVDVHPRPAATRELTLRPGRVELLMGYRPDDEEIRTALDGLGLSPTREGSGPFRVRVPSFRVDLEREADLVEEVGRHLGYDRIPAEVGGVTISLGARPADGAADLEERARDVLAHQGFREAFSYAMIAAAEDDPFVPDGTGAALALDNPIAEPLSHLRRSIVPGLIRAADLNLRRGIEDVRLFEVGRVFLPRGEGELPDEPLRAGLVWCGAAEARHWSVPFRPVALHDLAGAVDLLVRTLRPTLVCRREPGAVPGLHPGQSQRWLLPSGEVLGFGGALHPRLRAKLDLPADVLCAEIELDLLAAAGGQTARHRALPRFPGVSRDLSLVLSRDVTFERVREALAAVPSPAPAELTVVDRYEGRPLDRSEVALTVRFTLQPEDRTLTDEETEAYRERLVRTLNERLGVRLRA